MANRVTESDVTAILDTDAPSATIDAFITTANAFITQAGLDSVLGAAILTQIEKFLAAHFISSSYDRQALKESIGDGEYSVTYTGDFGKFLESTSYGQAALAMDTTGRLSSVGLKRASMEVYKTPRPYIEEETATS